MGSTDTQPQADEVGLTVSPAYTAGMFGDLYGDLLGLIKPALDEMVCEGFAVGWQIDMVKRDYIQFSNKRGVWIAWWDDSAELRWTMSSADHQLLRGATLGEVMAKAAGFVL